MCGIAGIINDSFSSEYLDACGKSMLNTLVHRGPDSSGIWVSAGDGLFLGHRRLSIQDLSECGAQPMLSHSGRYVIVFNGEIYNFKELTKELKKVGCKFRGHSDTEVLIEAIDTWGLETAVSKLTGMFAFALWDKKEKVLHLCRDRVGEKPLYYGVIEGAFYFSSELKAIESVLDKSLLNINKTALGYYLKYGYINAPYSIFEGISKLIPGTLVSVCIGDIKTNQLKNPVSYWSINKAATQGKASLIESEDEATELLNDVLNKTISSQLIADVSVGAFLSGGIDSTLVSAIAQNQSTRNINTFTIGFHEKEFDESIYAKRIAKHIGSNHHEVFVSSQDAMNVIPSLSDIYDEPFADSSQIPTYLVSKIAKQHVTVCLSGDGGDELFAGYNRYMWLNYIWNRTRKFPYLIRKNIGILLSVPSPSIWDKLNTVISMMTGGKVPNKLLGLKLQKLAGLLQQEDISSAYEYLMSYWANPGELLNFESNQEYSSKPDDLPSMKLFEDEAMYWDQMTYLPGDNLVKVDRASMNVSLETRLPLLSHEIIELSWRFPLSYKVEGNVGKLPLRRILEKYVPKSLTERPKMGFSVPVSMWLRNDLKVWAEDLLFSKPGLSDGYFKEDTLTKIWKQHQSGIFDHSHRLWTVLMYLSWEQSR